MELLPLHQAPDTFYNSSVEIIKPEHHITFTRNSGEPKKAKSMQSPQKTKEHRKKPKKHTRKIFSRKIERRITKITKGEIVRLPSIPTSLMHSLKKSGLAMRIKNKDEKQHLSFGSTIAHAKEVT